MNSDNDLLITDTEIPVLNDSLIFDPVELYPPSKDLLSLNKQIKQLYLILNTQHLKIEVEKLRRQKLRVIIKRVEQELTSNQQLLTQIQSDKDIMRERIDTISNTYASELVRLSLVTHCCFSRFHQLLTSVIPRISMPFNEYEEVSQLTHELLRVIQLLKSTSHASSIV